MPTDGALAVPPPLGLELAELARAVSSARERVAGFLAGSESVFLDTGEALEQLRNQALSLVGLASKVVDGARPRDSDPVEGLEQGCRRIDLHLAASRRSLDAKSERLRGVLAAIDRLGTFRHLFRRAASALRMLGMSTSIENARAGMESTGFGTVASDVRRLGGLVETKLDSVLDEALTMKRTAGDALVRVADLTRRQGERASSMLDDAAAGLASLRALAQAAAAVGATTSDVSNRIVGSVNSVVVSLQVHDITRQMMEHTLEGLQEIDADLAPLLHAGVPDATAEGIDAGEMVELCRLQSSQLREARSKLEQALRAIPANLKAMSATVNELAGQTASLDERSSGVSLLESVEAGVAHAVSVLREQLAQETEIEGAMTRVMTTIAEMLSRLRDVERIGHDLKIIGLNAGVEAAKTTHGGRVLSVLARAIQELSTEVGDQTAAFAGVVHEIAGEASPARGGAAGAESIADGVGIIGGESIAQELEGLLDNLRAYSGELEATIGSLVDAGGALSRGVEEISMRIERQERDLTVLETAEGELRAATAALGARGVTGTGGRTTQRLLRASARYTVESERAIHRSTTGTSGGAAPGSRGGRATGGALIVPPAGPGLGDNVELF